MVFLNKMKRGQVSLFIVVGIIIVILVFFLVAESKEPKVIFPSQDIVDDCVENGILQGVKEIALRNIELNPNTLRGFAVIEGVPIHKGIPNRIYAESLLEDYIKSSLSTCLFSENVHYGDAQVNVEILNEIVAQVELNNSIKDFESKILSRVFIKSPLQEMMSASGYVIDQTNRYLDLGLLATLPWETEVLPVDGGVVVVMKEEDITYQFAVEVGS